MPPASISAHSDLTTFICTLWSGSSFITPPRFVNIGFQTENSKVKLFLQLPERFFQDRETTLKLLVRNYKRHQHPDYVAVITAGEQYQSLFVADSGKLLRLISGRLLGFAVTHQLQRQHRPPAAHIADDLVLLLHGQETLTQLFAQFFSPFEQAVLNQYLQHRQGRSACKRVAAVGPAEPPDMGLVHYFRAAGDGAERHASRQTLGCGDDVRFDA